MKLLVIILCLASERYLIHGISNKRFFWFSQYAEAITKKFQNHEISLATQLLVLSLIIAPVLILCGLALYLLGPLLWGLVGFLLHLAIFYYCLGPENPFYPVRKKGENNQDESEIGDYFSAVNCSLFAVIFWYVILGPLGILFYRMVALARYSEMTAFAAEKLSAILDWLPARVTALSYLLVGNFQKGVPEFKAQFLLGPENNNVFLNRVGLLAAKTQDNDEISMPRAESIVSHAVGLYLLFLAIFTLVAWL